ncbi:MAG: hypothetical protein WDK96_03260 [Candidatus Paceibacterota bacterium]|jgi:tRNA pseudouridine55 synthase
MEQKVFNLYKKIGETPLQRLDRFINEGGLLGEKLSYVGRLDPMASGVMIVVLGDENKNRANYLSFDKEYEFEVIFGVSTDTHDLLGKITSFDNKKLIQEDFSLEIEKELKTFLGKIKQKYPIYSSKPVSGKPLFEWAREDRLEEIEIPEKEIEVFNTSLSKTYQISRDELENNIKEKIELISGDFRQEEILKTWDKYLKENSQESYLIAKIKINCSSGTYVRKIVDDLGKKLGIPTTTFSISRTRVGDYKIEDSMK